MDIVESIPALGATSVAAAVSLKSPELLKEIYGDVAKPGVAQVGKALGSILGLGNTILIPLRILNEAGRTFEQWSFGQIADRFRRIEDNEVIPPAPEIAVPLIEKLSQTRDPNIRQMFIELLAKASTADQINLVHPTFPAVVSSMAPDEAVILKSFVLSGTQPLLAVRLGYQARGRGDSTLHDLIMVPPVGVSRPESIPIFLANLSALGLLDIHRDSYLTAPDAYNDLEIYAGSKYPVPEKIVIGDDVRIRNYKRFVCETTPLGKSLLAACVEEIARS